jgi:hypothetical protein
VTPLVDAIGWLERHSILDAINAFGTVALVFFALVQIWRTEVERRERIRAAVGGFWIEYFRLWRVSNSWEERDLTSDLYAGLFDPDEILPPDWGALLPLIGALGALPARLGGLAYAYAADAASEARLARRYAQSIQELSQSDQRTELAIKHHDRLYATMQEAIERAQRKARLAADSLEDAISAAPRWSTKTRFEPELLRSGPGRALVERIEQRNAALPLWRRVLGRFFPSLRLTVKDREPSQHAR